MKYIIFLKKYITDMKQENGHVTKITNLSKDKVLRDLWASSAGFLDGGVLTVEPD